MKRHITCTHCGKTLPAIRKNFKREIKNGKEQFSNICKDCYEIVKIENEWKDGKLLCHICGEYKDIDEFQIHKHYDYRQHREKRCRKCKQLQNKYARAQYNDDKKLYKVLQERWFAARDRSKIKNIPFTISKEDLIELWDSQRGLCNISKIPMTYELDNGRVYTNVSLDQKIPGIGYTKNNIQLVCSAVNQLKSNWDMDVVKYICQQIVNNYE